MTPKTFDELLNERLTRRRAIGKGAGIAAGTVAGLVIGGAAGYFGGGAGAGAQTVTSTSTLNNTVTQTQTLTQTATAVSSTTATVTSATTATVTTTSAGASGPGIDYYYDPALKGSTITFLAANVPETPFVQQFAPLFTQETGIKVNIVTQPEDVEASKANIAFAAQSSDYDIIHGSGFGAFAYAWFLQGFLEDMTPYVQKTPSGYSYDDILPVVRNLMTYNGSLFCLPYGTIDWLYFYRTDLLPSAPKTVADVISAADKLNNPPSLYGFTAAGTPNIYSFFTWEGYLWAEGGDWIDPTNFHPTLNTQAAINATKDLLALAKDAPSFTSTDLPTSATYMAQGVVAQETNGATWYPLSIIGKDSKVIGKTSYAPFPKAVSQPHMLASITNSISKFSKNKDAAWSFISFISSPRIVQSIFNANYGSLIRTSALNNADNKKKDPFTFDYLGWLASAVPAGTNLGAPVVAERILPAVPRSPDFIDIVVKNLAQVFAGTSSVQDALNAAQSSATQLMQSTGLYK